MSDALPAIIHRSGANAIFAAREFFDGTIRNEHTRHAIVLNPALSVRGERYAAIEGRTPEISIAWQAAEKVRPG